MGVSSCSLGCAGFPEAVASAGALSWLGRATPPNIAMGCVLPERPADRQVHVQYSVDFGVSWKYLVPQCLPADPRCGGQVSQPSVFFPAEGWKRANFYIGPACEDHCGGHGDCLDQRCICDPGFTGPNCYASSALKASLKERFDWEGRTAGPNCGVLVEGTALYFGGADARQAVTTDLDLRGAKFVEYWARIGSDDNMTMCHRPTCRREGVLLDYSTDGGVSWSLLHEMDYLKYVSVRRDYIVLPEASLTNATRLRWWQPFTVSSGLASPSLERAQWAIDNILVGGSDINPSTLLDTFDDEGVSHEESWSFYPNAVRTAGFCGNPSFHLYWPNKNQDHTHNILATRELIVQPGYILQFKIVVGCEADTCEDHHSVLLQFRKDARSDSWQLVQSECLPSAVNNVGCSPFQFHESTIYSPVNSSTWTRVTVQLPDHVSSGATQFRWIQKEGQGERHSWGVDHVYIGEACPGVCSGHGYCTSGVNWQLIQGGGVGSGCGQLSPHAHGDSLYFSGCKMRQAVTKPLDLTRASKIMFVLQIGSATAVNSGVSWHVVAQHQPKDFIKAQRASLKERFDWEGRTAGPQWQMLEGGRPCTDCGVLVEGTALYFGGADARQAVTTDLDLRGAKFVEYWARIGSDDNMTMCHRPTCRREGVLLDYSTDGGVSWSLLHEMDYLKYVSVRRDYIVLPEASLTNATRLRWWQPFTVSSGLAAPSLERAQWAIDNILVGGSDINPSTLLDTFDDEGVSHEESWSFYPNAVRTAGFCGNPSFHLYWPNKNQDHTHNILATRELIVQPGYILQFKIVVGCEADTCEDHHSVLLQFRKDARSDSWQLVQSECLPSAVNNVGCSPFQFHESTIYSPVNSSTWTRVTVQLPDHVSSGATQFRWIQKEGQGERHSWGVDHVYIGEACPGVCSGHGYCTSGVVCICDEGYHGDDCSLSASDLPSSIKDNFESGSVSPENWQLIQGGGVGSGCGQLSPHAHGDSLYFSGCKMRQAVTKPLDLTRASKIMFVLQIGSASQTDSCNVALDQADTVDRAVLLQYSVNSGVSWHVVAQHQPKDFIKAQRVSYNIPLEARVKGVMLRWWQPRHAGAGRDQWALDHVEVVLKGRGLRCPVRQLNLMNLK
ncbi:hypothetical protein CRUP_004162 [Coryphaenoides rupestris]|nr:hypothetical protein CRUP_004162 [Coryphaenoides rupestris]